MALSDHLDALYEELIGRILSDVDREARLQFMQFFLYLEDDIRYLVGGTVSVTVHTPDIDIREVVVRAALQSRYSNLRRRRLVVELNPQTRDQFFSLLTGERAISQSFLIEGIEMLVEMSGIHRVPAVQLCDRS